jgi:AcrR family transcriptional regulator
MRNQKDGEGLTLRERKRERTRQALVAAAAELFERHGYDETTIADIAARADIGTRTVFSYFPTKEDLLFPDIEGRIQAALEVIATREDHERPAEVLLRALRHVAATGNGILSDQAALRMRLLQTVPAVRGRAMQLQLDAQRAIAGHLHSAFADELDEVAAAALVGAFVGAVVGALQAVLTDQDNTRAPRKQLSEQVREATRIALRPWLG